VISRISLALKELAAIACLVSDGVNHLVNAQGVFKRWVVLSALDVLNAFTAVVSYRNKTCSLALASCF
jgi:hypothetical protein